jgi:HEAT repeat protein
LAFGSEVTQKALCPFCGRPLNRPLLFAAHRPGEMPLGVCSCGAVYACDVTGHNLGAAFVEALVFACNSDWDLAWGLVPGDDYEEKIIPNYDDQTNLLVPGGFLGGRTVRGALYFVRLLDDVRVVTEEGVRRHAPRPPAPAAPRAPEKIFSAAEVAEMVGSHRLEVLVEQASPRPLVRQLQRLLYSGDELLRLGAAETLGLLAAARSEEDPDFFAGLVRRLLAALEDPGAFCAGALDAAGEIIAGSPRAFAGFIPALASHLDDPVYRPGVLRALYRIARVNPALVRRQACRLLPLLHDAAAPVRGYAAALLARLGEEIPADSLQPLLDDRREIQVWENGYLQRKTVRQLAAGLTVRS